MGKEMFILELEHLLQLIYSAGKKKKIEVHYIPFHTPRSIRAFYFLVEVLFQVCVTNLDHAIILKASSLCQ